MKIQAKKFDTGSFGGSIRKSLKVFLAAVVLAGSATSFASEAEVLLQVRTSGGFMPPGRHLSTGVKVYRNGIVEAFTRGRTSELAVLSSAVTQGLEKAVERMDPSIRVPSVDLSKPLCMDAPGTIYKAQKTDGTEIRFAAKISCQTLVASGNYASQLKGLLDGLNQAKGMTRIR